MSPASSRGRGPVVIDTSVFSSELVRRGAPIAEAYRPLVEGRSFIISFVTLAEVRFGARIAGWGSTRLQRLEQRLVRATVIWPGPELVDTYVNLRTSCVHAGTLSDRRTTKPIGGSPRQQPAQRSPRLP